MSAVDQQQYYQGPSDLAAAIQRAIPGRLMMLSTAALYKLVSLVYRVSLMKEEGRYPCFQILVPQFLDQAAALSVRFESPLLLDSETLHRLAPGVPQRPFALFVREEPGATLKAYGIGRAESSVLALDDECEESWSQTRPWGLSLFVTGPGQLLASIITKDMSLPRFTFLAIGNGVIRSINQFNAGWLEVGFGIHHPVSALWPKILTEAQALGHGGMFVILPPGMSLDAAQRVIHVEHRTREPDLGAIFDDLARAQDQDAKQRLCDAVRTVVQLSSVDGCVVLSSTMQLLGFAAEVNVYDNAHLPETVLIKIDPPNDTQMLPLNLKRFGTRHRSAARVCSKLGARVFVVSQDGAIRAFERLYDGKVSIRGPFACGPGLSPDPLSGTFIDVLAEAPEKALQA